MAQGATELAEFPWLLVDTFVHATAFGVAVWNGFSNRRRFAAALACLSPIVFILVFDYGPGEHRDGFPSAFALAAAYVVANTFLVGGLLLGANPEGGETSDDEAGAKRRSLLAATLSGYLVLVSLFVAVTVVF